MNSVHTVEIALTIRKRFCACAVSQLFVLALLNTPGYAVTLEWMQQFGTVEIPPSNGYDRAHGISADNFGNVVVAGTTDGSLGGPNQGHTDAFVSKLDAAGNLSWSAQFGKPSGFFQDQAFDVSTDTVGSVYIVGEYGGGSPWDAFLNKYNAAGNLVWSRLLETVADERARSVSTDGLGNVYVSGSTSGDLGGPSAGEDDLFVSKFNAEGTRDWVRQLGSDASDASYGIAADALGNVFFAGSTRGNLGGPFIGGDRDAFVGKYDASGNLLWTRQFGTTGQERATSVSADGLGNVYVAGWTTGSLDGINAGFFDVFVRKYDTAGNLLWARQFGTSGDEGGCCLANPGEGGSGTGFVGVTADSSGSVYVASGTSGDLGGPNAGGAPSPPYRWDAFVTKFDAAGSLKWTEQFGTSAWEFATDVYVDGLGNIYLSGTTQCFSASCTLDGSNAFWADAFVAKYHETNIPEPTSAALVVLALACVAMCRRATTLRREFRRP